MRWFKRVKKTREESPIDPAIIDMYNDMHKWRIEIMENLSIMRALEIRVKVLECNRPNVEELIRILERNHHM